MEMYSTLYADQAFASAIGEITLVFFTTLAPSGALAFILMALPLIFKGNSISVEMQRSVEKYLSAPILVAMIGLVASATHLGNPANALYVFTGFGRSPLSNEVVFGVLFLGAGAIYWLTSFSIKERNRLSRKIALSITSAFGLLFIWTMSYAYDAETIITWSNPLVPASVWMNSLVGGPLLAILGFRLARFFTEDHKYGKVLIAISAIALIVNTAIYVLWENSLLEISNSLTTAETISIPFPFAIIWFFLFSAVAIVLGTKAVRHKGETPIYVPVISTLCVFTGIFMMRLFFYTIHMTVGLSI